MIDDNDIINEDFVEGLDYDTITGEFPQELRENFNVSTKVTCYVCEKFFHLLSINRKQHTKMFHRAYTKSSSVQLDYEPKAILFSKKFSSKKVLSQFIKQKENFVNSVEIVLGVDPENNKQDTIQYVPILPTLNVLLFHEDVLTFVLNPEQENSKSGYLHTFRDGEALKNNDLFRTSQNCLKIVFYHDDLGTVNSLGNEVITESSKDFERKLFRVILIIKNHWLFKNTLESLLREPLQAAFT